MCTQRNKSSPRANWVTIERHSSRRLGEFPAYIASQGSLGTLNDSEVRSGTQLVTLEIQKSASFRKGAADLTTTEKNWWVTYFALEDWLPLVQECLHTLFAVGQTGVEHAKRNAGRAVVFSSYNASSVRLLIPRPSLRTPGFRPCQLPGGWPVHLECRCPIEQRYR
jgi:hypothetical protein